MKMLLRFTIFVLIFATLGAMQAKAVSCNNTAMGSFTCKASCSGYTYGVTDQACGSGFTVASGDVIYVYIVAGSTSTTVSITGCAPVPSWSLPDGQVADPIGTAVH